MASDSEELVEFSDDDVIDLDEIDESARNYKSSASAVGAAVAEASSSETGPDALRAQHKQSPLLSVASRHLQEDGDR